MYASVAELEELVRMREEVRRSVEALEVCWLCQRVSDCEQHPVDDGPPVWLCCACQEKLRAQRQKAPGPVLWPGIS